MSDAAMRAALERIVENLREENCHLHAEIRRAQSSADFWRRSWTRLVFDVGDLVRPGEPVAPDALGDLLASQCDGDISEVDLG